MKHRSGILSTLVIVAFILAVHAQSAHAVAVVKVTAGVKYGIVENIPLNNEVVWVLEATVGNHTSSEPITKVEFRDVYIAEVTIDAVLLEECGPATILPGKTPGTTELRWAIGAMAPGQTCKLHFQVSTADGPPHEFTTAGEHCLNNGAMVRFLNALSEQEARTGPSICVTTE